jgi:transposase
MRKRRTAYTPEFKQQAISLVQEANRPAATVARELGINVNTIYNWLSASTSQGARNSVSDAVEIKRLKKELAQSNLERDILKKAAAYFAKETL